MARSLNHEAVVPLYHQLKEIILETIESDEWKPGELIPSEYQFVERFNVSRNTVKKAIETLVQEGALFRVQGKGTYVAMPKLEQSLSSFYSFSRVIRDRGLQARDIVLNVREARAVGGVAKRLQIQVGQPVLELERLRCMEEDPFVLEVSHLPKDLVPQIDVEELQRTSLYDFIRDRYGILVTKAKESFEPVLISDYEARHLQTHEGYPALLLHRVAYDASGTVIEYCKSIVRGDKCRFYTELV